MNYTIQHNARGKYDWSSEGIGDVESFDTKAEAEEAVESLLELGDSWCDHDWRIVDTDGNVVCEWSEEK